MYALKHIPTGLRLPYLVYSPQDAKKVLRKLNRQLSSARHAYSKYHLPTFTLHSIGEYAYEQITKPFQIFENETVLPLNYILCPPSKKTSSITFLYEAKLFRTWTSYLRRCKVLKTNCRASNITILEALAMAVMLGVLQNSKLNLDSAEFILIPYET